MTRAYDDAYVLAALRAPRRRWSFEYRRFDVTGSQLDNVNVASCHIDNDDLADVKRRAKFTIKETDAQLIDFTSDRIQPIAKLLMPDGGWNEWAMGMFLLSSPSRVRAGGPNGATRDVDAFDLGQVLNDDLVDDRYVVPAGVRYVTALSDLLTSAGLQTVQISSVDAVSVAAQEWEGGTSKRVISVDMLKAINYASISFDGNGSPVAPPYISPMDATSIYDYAIDRNSVVTRDGFTETLDLSSVPNVMIMYVSTPDNDSDGNPIVLRSEYSNDNPASQTSTVSVGRRIVSYQQVNDIADQRTLDAACKAALEEASQVYALVDFKTGLMPFHTSGDVMTLDWGEGKVKFREATWGVDLVAGAPMTHQVRRVVQV